MIKNKNLFLVILLLLATTISCNEKVHFDNLSSFEKSIYYYEDSLPESLSSSTNFYPESQTINKNNLNYFFITDLHIDSEKELKECNAVLDWVADYTNNNDFLDFICVGGDLTTLYFESKQEWIEWCQSILLPLKKCRKPIFILNGNHDDNSNCSLEKLDSDNLVFKEWNEYVFDFIVNVDIKQDDNYQDSKYYYFDYSKNNIDYRIVCLDSNDRPESSNNKEYWGFSDKQVIWLEEKALKEPNKQYIILSHMSVDGTLNVDHRTIQNSDAISNLIKDKVNYEVLINSFGHCHLAYLGKNSFGLPSSCTATLLYGGIGGYDGQSLYPELNILDAGWQLTKKDKWGFSLDILSVSSKEIKKIAIGDGTDQILNL